MTIYAVYIWTFFCSLATSLVSNVYVATKCQELSFATKYSRASRSTNLCKMKEMDRAQGRTSNSMAVTIVKILTVQYLFTV